MPTTSQCDSPHANPLAALSSIPSPTFADSGRERDAEHPKRRRQQRQVRPSNAKTKPVPAAWVPCQPDLLTCLYRRPCHLLRLPPDTHRLPWRPRPHLFRPEVPPPHARDHCAGCPGSEAAAQAFERDSAAGRERPRAGRAGAPAQRSVGHHCVVRLGGHSHALRIREDRSVCVCRGVPLL